VHRTNACESRSRPFMDGETWQFWSENWNGRNDFKLGANRVVYDRLTTASSNVLWYVGEATRLSLW